MKTIQNFGSRKQFLSGVTTPKEMWQGKRRYN